MRIKNDTVIAQSLVDELFDMFQQLIPKSTIKKAIKRVRNYK
ncbi:MAG: hypothetical protein PHE67_12070 [Campylobacterales bacterium]|nr:hypothetical protein [Campylobacterales bacterium]